MAAGSDQPNVGINYSMFQLGGLTLYYHGCSLKFEGCTCLCFYNEGACVGTGVTGCLYQFASVSIALPT